MAKGYVNKGYTQHNQVLTYLILFRIVQPKDFQSELVRHLMEGSSIGSSSLDPDPINQIIAEEWKIVPEDPDYQEKLTNLVEYAYNFIEEENLKLRAVIHGHYAS